MSRFRFGRARRVTGVLAWLVAVAAATAVGMAAVGMIGSGIVGAGERPLSQSEVDGLLSARPSTTTTTPPPGTSATTTAPTSQTSAPAEQVFSVRGGTIIARCASGRVAIISTVPAQGYQVDSDNEVDDHPSVEFTRGDEEVEVRLRCVGGTVQHTVETDWTG